ncbi:MAG: ABC transporter substrate-binding protein [Actinomycetaceae bacterium]|nr:ABC transporter substrate-binding protein [Actinomycetaceae bacterium]
MKRTRSLATALLISIALFASSCASGGASQSGSQSAATPASSGQSTATPSDSAASTAPGDGAASADSAPSVAATGPRTITDHGKKQVTLPAKIERVAFVQIPIESTYLAYFNGEAPYLVGMAKDRVDSLKQTIAADIAPEMFEVESGYMDKGELNIESLRALNPDVVFYNSFNAKHAELFEQAGIPAVGFTTLGDPSQTYAEWMKLLEQVFNEPGKMDKKIAAGKTLVDDAEQRAAGVPENQRKSAAVVMNASGGQLAVAGGKDGWFTDSWAKRMNFINASADTDESHNPITFEQMLAWNPDVLLITGKGMSNMTAKTVLSNQADIDFSPLKAHQNKAVYSTGLGMWNWFTPNPDSPIVANWLGKTLYPDKFQDVDLVKITKEYYSTMYSFELTDEQAREILLQDADD